MGLLLSVRHSNERTGTRCGKGSELAPLKRSLRVSKLAILGRKGFHPQLSMAIEGASANAVT